MKVLRNVIRKQNSGVAAWAIILVGAGIYDIHAARTEYQTLSSAIWQVNRNPWGRFVMFGLWAGLSYHLFAELQYQLREAEA